ncbi:MAG TPA: hypothetical protein PKE26_02940 [Kiritimatiellia bacterium]|nr:hypothetical protein [Kiritimatiellia bacterium]HMO98045.1 hypothetical protein [Kiritimatiellia bacterium]HMP97401.1 hypothetical protein [Kiritimatiellia bacterium]
MKQLVIWMYLIGASGVAGAQSFITQDMLPLTISQPGQYVVAGPLTHALATPAISVTTNHVSIDLNGYTLRYTGVFENGGSGIFQTEAARNLVVRNGALTGWGRAADTAAIRALGDNNRFEDMRIHQCGRGLLSGRNAHLARVHVTDISGISEPIGIFTGVNALISDSLVGDVLGTLSVGIRVGHNSVVEHCVVRNILGGTSAVGISLGSGKVQDSVLHLMFGGSQAAGINADHGVHVEGCAIGQVWSSVEAVGVAATTQRSRVYRSALMGVGGSASESYGIRVRSGQVVENSVYGTLHNGVDVTTAAQVRYNALVTNNASGVLIRGRRNVIEGNLLAGGASAINFAGFVDNLAIRNADYSNITPFGGVGNHTADVLGSPGVDFTHPNRATYFENVVW